jgi:hypothetical protein
MTNKQSVINPRRENGSIKWERFERCWKTAAAVATLVHPLETVQLRTSEQLEERNKTIKKKIRSSSILFLFKCILNCSTFNVMKIFVLVLFHMLHFMSYSRANIPMLLNSAVFAFFFSALQSVCAADATRSTSDSMLLSGGSGDDRALATSTIVRSHL